MKTRKESTVLPLRRFASGIVAALALCLAAGAGAEPPQTLTPARDLKRAPDITLETVGGGKVRLADLRGKVVVVNFWATWCPPCKREMPSLQRLSELLKGEPVEVIAINAGEDDEDIERFRAGMDPPLTFRLALDRNGDAMQAFAVHGLPTTLVIDRKGRIAFHALGDRNFEDPNIVATIRALAAK
ncbi:MAG TPA: TlpA disulfide reductase family protein [Usitatibacteraceae bacterium]|nr:TlpA disulfide reductase family protein [Usitatibacteraceae bacterium]